MSRAGVFGCSFISGSSGQKREGARAVPRLSTLRGQCKTGHAGSLQNRPYEMARDVILFIPLSPDQASLFWFSNFLAHI